MYYFVRLVFFNCAFALSYAKKVNMKTIVIRYKSWKVASKNSAFAPAIASYTVNAMLSKINTMVAMQRTLKALLQIVPSFKYSTKRIPRIIIKIELSTKEACTTTITGEGRAVLPANNKTKLIRWAGNSNSWSSTKYPIHKP